MAQLTAAIVSHDEEFKHEIARMLRSCGVPMSIIEGRAAQDGSTPDIGVIDIRSDAPSGMAAIERLRAATDAGDLRHRAARRVRSDPAGDAGGRQRVLPLGRRDGSRRARLRTPSTAPCAGWRRGAKRPTPAQAAVRHARLLRRQGRRGHDDRQRQLRGRAGAAHQAPDGHPRPEARVRRGLAVPRRAPALHGARRAREPAPPRQGLPARARARSTSRDWRSSPAPSSSSGPAARTPARSRSCSACSASRTTTSSSTPATSSTPAASRRSMPPTRSSSSRTPTCRRCATRSGWSIACGSWASAASGSGFC